MIRIFHAPGARSLRVVWMAEEMGLEYALEKTSLLKPSEAFLAANPTRTLPVMVDGDLVLTESLAIAQYLAARYGPTTLEPDHASPDYPAYLQFLHLGESSLAAPLTNVVRARFMAPEDQRENWTVENCKSVFLNRLRLVETRLTESAWLAGEHFTIADISVGYALMFGEFLGLSGRYSPAVVAYFERLKARPAFQAAAQK